MCVCVCVCTCVRVSARARVCVNSVSNCRKFRIIEKLLSGSLGVTDVWNGCCTYSELLTYNVLSEQVQNEGQTSSLTWLTYNVLSEQVQALFQTRKMHEDIIVTSLVMSLCIYLVWNRACTCSERIL